MAGQKVYLGNIPAPTIAPPKESLFRRDDIDLSSLEALHSTCGSQQVYALDGPGWEPVTKDLLPMLAKKEVVYLLAVKPTGHGWMQQDSQAMHKVDGRMPMYANIILVNTHMKPPVEVRMRALVDTTTAGLELIIPPCTAQQLKLKERSRGQLRGYEGGVALIRYASALVKLPCDTSSGQEQIFKQADLTVYAKDVPLVQQEDLSNLADFRQPQQLSAEGNLQLTPVSSPPRGEIATAIIGKEGLRRLNVTIHPDQALLCPMEPGDECIWYHMHSAGLRV